ncbi:hypothetical protein BDN72DRAFT_670793 [Pluteus cervinus]|uniref:Uncharacterized protein n=1 Tax=Pluteus cervinus TaxID=181527 RepID=A0ACD3B9Q4_9AGAR|nr:hypothetical protein BDN72DRAFT_670793 [Pluteus cervinus]
MPKTRNVSRSASGASLAAHGNTVVPPTTTTTNIRNVSTALSTTLPPAPQSPLPAHTHMTPKRPKKQPFQDITARYVADAPEVSEGLGLGGSEEDVGKALAVTDHRYGTATPTSSVTSGVRSLTPTPAGPKRFMTKDKGKGKEMDLFQGRPSLLGSLRRERSSLSTLVHGVVTTTAAETIRNAHTARLTSALKAAVGTVSRTSSFVATPKHPNHVTTGEGSEGATPHRDRVLVPASSDDNRDQGSPLPPSSPPRDDDAQETQETQEYGSLPVPTSTMIFPHEYETPEVAEGEEDEPTQLAGDPEEEESDDGVLPGTTSGNAGNHLPLPPTPPSDVDPWGIMAVEHKLKVQRQKQQADAAQGSASDAAGPSTTGNQVTAATSGPAPLATKHATGQPGRKIIPPRTPHKPRKRKRVEPERMEVPPSRFPQESEVWSGGHSTPETPSPLKRSAKRRESKLHESALRAALASAAITSGAGAAASSREVGLHNLSMDARSSPEQMRKIQARQAAKARLLAAAADGEVDIQLPEDGYDEDDVGGEEEEDKENQADAFSMQTELGYPDDDDIGAAEAEVAEEEEIEIEEEIQPDPTSPPPAKRARRTKPEPPQSSPVKTRALRSRTSKAPKAKASPSPRPTRKLAVYVELPLLYNKSMTVEQANRQSGAGAKRGRKRKVDETSDSDDGEEEEDKEGDYEERSDESEVDADEDEDEGFKRRSGRKRVRTSATATENKISRPVRATRSSTGGAKSTTTIRTRSATTRPKSKANALKPKTTTTSNTNKAKTTKGKGKGKAKAQTDGDSKKKTKKGTEKPKSTLHAFAMQLESDDREAGVFI